jgi:methionyl-tRNA synthetase
VIEFKKFYITTAIDYVNAPPHAGHAYEKIVADILARWHRLKGESVFFLTGTDENAQKNEQAAKEAKMDTKTFVDRNVQKFKELCKILNISHNRFIRTTEKEHIKISQDLFKKVFDKGDIYKGFYEGYYCTGCEAFLTEKDLVNNKCPEHDKKPDWIKEESYFFKMSKYTQQILELVSKKGFIEPEGRRIEIYNRVKSEGLKDLSVSRINREWGIDVPVDDKHKIYVWFDALINYVSGLDYPGGNFKKYWPAEVHMIGKGINWFHSVIWPAMLISARITVPKKIVVHGYVNIAGKKMSKSAGTKLDPIEIVKKYGADPLRYFLIRDIPFGEDGDFSEDALKARINGELVSDLGNLVNRVLTISEKFDGKIEGKDELSKNLNMKRIEQLMERLELHHAIDETWSFIRAANKYINEKEPWKLRGKGLGNVLYNLLESLRVISILISPFIPAAAERINRQLGLKAGKLKDTGFREWKGKPEKGELLFRKV